MSTRPLAEATPGRRRETPLTIDPPARWRGVDLRELWEYRGLLYFLVWRDLKVRYKQTVFGGAWAVAQPFLTMVVMTIVFEKLLSTPSDGEPYPLFSYAALVPWALFASGMARAGNSLVADPSLLSKVYFPRLTLPLAAVTSVVVDFAIAFVILVGMMAYYGVTPGVEALTLPLFALLAYATALGMGLWLSSLNVRYRDIAYVIPLVLQFWLLLTPVAYPSSLVPESLRTLYALNPMTGVVEGFRWALLGTDSATGSVVFVSAAVVAVVCITGVLYFRRTESGFADVV